MYEYIKGKITVLTPTFAVVETNGIGYNVNISLQTYSKFEGVDEAKLFLHQIVREDANLLFGFYGEDEREVFRLLLTVSGIGANTARMMLSSLSADDIRSAIIKDDVSRLKSVKGVGLKTAQRIVVDLKDKIIRVGVGTEVFASSGSTLREEALAALVALGFAKMPAEKTLTDLLKGDSDYTVESLIKAALKQL
ncbi:MAG: Holliday junction branch migration protein RuvA [Prevotellaceae bacterium]|jgi:Holliday junction DNA helicase RuvA|nr:Holliday junction branch migration protein RuvA [Prevotellaceae bacterium]